MLLRTQRFIVPGEEKITVELKYEEGVTI